MSTFEDIFCSQCNCKTDQALMLSCEHNLCMNCAAKHLSQENPQTSNSKQYIICDLCGSKTEIDNETSREILSTVLKNLNLNPNLLNQRISNSQNNTFSENLNPNLNINTNPNNIMSNNEIIYNTMNIPNNNNISFNNGAYDMNNYNNNLLISNSNIVNQKNICREHGEPISYLCLDCMSKCICSECIVHGIHRNHDVLNIKKAYPCIKVGQAVLGLEVPHAHIHLVPMQKEKDMLFSNPKLQLTPDEFKEIAANIAAAF